MVMYRTYIMQEPKIFLNASLSESSSLMSEISKIAMVKIVTCQTHVVYNFMHITFLAIEVFRRVYRSFWEI